MKFTVKDGKECSFSEKLRAKSVTQNKNTGTSAFKMCKYAL